MVLKQGRLTEIDDRNPDQVQTGKEEISTTLNTDQHEAQDKNFSEHNTHFDTAKHDRIDQSRHSHADSPTGDSKPVPLGSQVTREDFCGYQESDSTPGGSIPLRS